MRTNVERELVNKWSSLVHPFWVIGFEGGYWIKRDFYYVKNPYKTKEHTKRVLPYNFCALCNYRHVFLFTLPDCGAVKIYSPKHIVGVRLLFVDSHKVLLSNYGLTPNIFWCYLNSYVFFKNIKQLELLGRVKYDLTWAQKFHFKSLWKPIKSRSSFDVV